MCGTGNAIVIEMSNKCQKNDTDDRTGWKKAGNKKSKILMSKKFNNYTDWR